jgi:hypothetical protein
MLDFSASLQPFLDMTGYEPKTTFWSDFCIAERFGSPAIRDTFKRAFSEWKSDHIFLTELVMVLNWKSWEWYDRGDHNLMALYDELWRKAGDYAIKNLKGEEMKYFIKTTD